MFDFYWSVANRAISVDRINGHLFLLSVSNAVSISRNKKYAGRTRIAITKEMLPQAIFLVNHIYDISFRGL
jgi:hypothetical protein